MTQQEHNIAAIKRIADVADVPAIVLMMDGRSAVAFVVCGGAVRTIDIIPEATPHAVGIVVAEQLLKLKPQDGPDVLDASTWRCPNAAGEDKFCCVPQCEHCTQYLAKIGVAMAERSSGGDAH